MLALAACSGNQYERARGAERAGSRPRSHGVHRRARSSSATARSSRTRPSRSAPDKHFGLVGSTAAVTLPAGVTKVDLTGLTVMPAIVDAHTHLSRERDALIADLKHRAYFGVSAALSLGQDNGTDVFVVRKEVIPGAALYRLAGRGITAPEPGRSDIPYWVTTEDEARAAVREQAALGVDIIKIWVDDRLGKYKKLAPELYGAAIDEAHKAGLRTIAHEYYLADAKELLRRGIDAFAHGVRDADVDDEFVTLIKAHRGLRADTEPAGAWRRDGPELALAVRCRRRSSSRCKAAAVDNAEAQAFFAIQARNLARVEPRGRHDRARHRRQHAVGSAPRDGGHGRNGHVAGRRARCGDEERRCVPEARRRGHRGAGQDRQFHRARAESARRHHEHAEDPRGVSARRQGGPRELLSVLRRSCVAAMRVAMVSLQLLGCSLGGLPSPAHAQGDGAVRGLYHFVRGTADAERSFAFYHEVLGIGLARSPFAGVPSTDAPPPRIASPAEAGSDPLVWDLTDTKGARFRTVFMRAANTPFGLELSEFFDIPRSERAPNPWDPGASIVAFAVRDLDTVLRAAQARGAPIVTMGGAPVNGPEGRVVLIRDPDGSRCQGRAFRPPRGHPRRADPRAAAGDRARSDRGDADPQADALGRARLRLRASGALAGADARRRRRRRRSPRRAQRPHESRPSLRARQAGLDRRARRLRRRCARRRCWSIRTSAASASCTKSSARPRPGGGARIDAGILEQVNCLVEWPSAVACSFEPGFLAVPQEALIATMEANQKFFPVLDAAGKLSERFVGIANIESNDVAEVRKGYERVIRPRFADAKFFFDEDLKQGLASMADGPGQRHLPGQARQRRRQGRARGGAGRSDRAARRRRSGAGAPRRGLVESRPAVAPGQ